MECIKCNQKNQIAFNSDSFKLCVSCVDEIKAGKSGVVCVKNDVVYYLAYYRSRGNYEVVAKFCETQYGEPEIEAGKKLLIGKTLEKLKEIDELVAKAGQTTRKTSPRRTKAAADILDIWNILKALEDDVNVVPDTGITHINPESLLPESVCARLHDLEEQMKNLVANITALTSENLKLKSEFENMSSPQAEAVVFPSASASGDL